MITYCLDRAAISLQNHKNRSCIQNLVARWKDCLTGQPAKSQQTPHDEMEQSKCGTTKRNEINGIKLKCESKYQYTSKKHF